MHTFAIISLNENFNAAIFQVTKVIGTWVCHWISNYYLVISNICHFRDRHQLIVNLFESIEIFVHTYYIRVVGQN